MEIVILWPDGQADFWPWWQFLLFLGIFYIVVKETWRRGREIGEERHGKR